MKPTARNGVKGMFMLFNKYDYLININHPQILPLYIKYKENKIWGPLSDEERLNFERAICNRSKFKADFNKWVDDNRYICPGRVDFIVERIRGDSGGK